jgi:hypothetical protein
MGAEGSPEGARHTPAIAGKHSRATPWVQNTPSKPALKGRDIGGKNHTKMHTMHKKKKQQKRRKFVGLEWHAALSAIGRVMKNLVNLCGQLSGICANLRNLRFPPLPGHPCLSVFIRGSFPFSVSWRSWRFNLWFFSIFVANYPGSASICVICGSPLSLVIRVYPCSSVVPSLFLSFL